MIIISKNNIRIVGTKPVPFTPSLIDATGNVTTTITLREGGTVNKQIPYPYFKILIILLTSLPGKK